MANECEHGTVTDEDVCDDCWDDCVDWLEGRR